MIEYVLGFAMARHGNKDYVVLLYKNRGPEEYLNKWNGVGGKMEPVEKMMIEGDLEAMVREFDEEAGLYVDNWKLLSRTQTKDYSLNVFAAKLDYEELITVYTKTDEEVRVFCVDQIGSLDLGPDVEDYIKKASKYL